MCGLVGIASPNLNNYDVKMFNDMLLWDVVRGKHSTGVCAVDKYGTAAVYKRALASPDFIQLKAYEQLSSNASQLLMGHNRYATCGAKDDNNAHPFQHGHITLVHNGTLTVRTVHQDKTKTFGTDSESICYALFENDNWIDTLERIEGAYALIWHDSRDNTLHFARNNERTLYLGWAGTDLVWSSLRSILTLAGEHHKTKMKDIELLPVGKHVTLDLDDYKNYTEEDFTPKKPRIRLTGTTGGTTRKTTTTHNSTSANKALTTYEDTGQKKRGWLFEVRETGFFRAGTVVGETLEGHVDISDVASFQKAMTDGRMIEGVVRSKVNDIYKNSETLFLSSKHLRIIPEDEENAGNSSNCAICLHPIKDGEQAEYHEFSDEVYHEACIDAYLAGGNDEDKNKAF